MQKRHWKRWKTWKRYINDSSTFFYPVSSFREVRRLPNGKHNNHMRAVNLKRWFSDLCLKIMFLYETMKYWYRVITTTYCQLYSVMKSAPLQQLFFLQKYVFVNCSIFADYLWFYTIEDNLSNTKMYKNVLLDKSIYI